MVAFTGGCLCGAVRYEVEGELLRAARCHCDDCRRSTGAAFATNVFVPADALKIVQGETKTYQHRTDSGSTMTRAFCADCGSPLYGFSSANEATRSIRVGAIDDASFVKPQIEVFTARKLACTTLGDDTEHFAEARPS